MKRVKFKGFELSGKTGISLACFLIAAMHLTFLVFFLNFKVTPLFIFNIGSVLLYVIMALILMERTVIKHYIFTISIIFVEVVVHAVLCTLLLGVDTFFVLYPIIALPICGYFLFFNIANRRTFLTAVITFIALTFLITAAAVGIAEFYGGVIPTDVAVLSRKEKMIFRVMNIFFAAMTLFGFTAMFFFEMNRLLNKLRESTEQLKYTATHDALTGLTNRRSFWEYFDRLCGGDNHYNIAMGDLDSFKNINDTYGHGCGDLVLKSVAELILDMTEENEIACRWGGEEMVVVLMGDRSDALKRLEDIRLKIEALKLNYEGLDVHVTMTFGFADSEEIGRAISENYLEKSDETKEAGRHYRVESLISMVDKRLYTGKGSGKNVVISD